MSLTMTSASTSAKPSAYSLRTRRPDHYTSRTKQAHSPPRPPPWQPWAMASSESSSSSLSFSPTPTPPPPPPLPTAAKTRHQPQGNTRDYSHVSRATQMPLRPPDRALQPDSSSSPTSPVSSTSMKTAPTPRSLFQRNNRNTSSKKFPDPSVPWHHRPTTSSLEGNPPLSSPAASTGTQLQIINGSFVFPSARPRQAVPAPPPPPPPPPPPIGLINRKNWAGQSNCEACHPASPNSRGTKSSAASADEAEAETPRCDFRPPKLKPLHWEKVHPSSGNAPTVWDQLKFSSFRVNEELIETLFTNSNSVRWASKYRSKGPFTGWSRRELRVLDPKKSQNIAIMLKALDVTADGVRDALLDGDADTFGPELFETLLRMAPSKEEEIKLRELDHAKLAAVERFLKAVLEVPFAFKRADALLYIANFDSEIAYLKQTFDTLEAACEELRSSRLFLMILDAVLKTGNCMNTGTSRGGARAFKLDTLLKLSGIKGSDAKTTVLHFVVQEIIRSEAAPRAGGSLGRRQQQGLKLVASLGNELAAVKKAAAMDFDMLTASVVRLAKGVGNVRDVQQMNQKLAAGEKRGRFGEAMAEFLRKAEGAIAAVQAQESLALSLVRETAEYFHGGDSVREDGQPFRVFAVVRDFLNILDAICKDIGKDMEEQTPLNSGRRFVTPVKVKRGGASDEESELSSS